MAWAPDTKDRLMYFADGGISAYNLHDPFTPRQLTDYVDAFADNGVGILSQLVFAGGGTKPGLFVPDHPEFPWWEEPKFKELIASGVQPLQLMIDRAHQRGMKFFCKLRMSDWHKRTIEQSGFVGRHPELHNPDIGRPTLDYTHDIVRDYHLWLVEELVRRFDIDGITYNFIRSWNCFPRERARESHPLMTSFIRRTRTLLDEWSARKGRRIELGAIVLPSIDFCRALGYDIATWTRENLIDYLSPGDGHYSDMNADHEAWAELCRDSRCNYFPMLQNGVAQDDKSNLLSTDQIRAVVKAMYEGGAGGVSVFNWVYYWSRRGGAARRIGASSGFPLAFAYLREACDPSLLATGPRHYLFRPIGMSWTAGDDAFEENDRVAFPRCAGARGEYPFTLRENLNETGIACVFVKLLGLSPATEDDRKRAEQRDLSTNAPGVLAAWGDSIALDLNGVPVPHEEVSRVWHHEGRWEKFGRPLGPHTSLWFQVDSSWARCGRNTLGVTVTTAAPNGEDKVTIEEVEVVVMPRPLLK